jgi:hypothetical protein
MISVADRWEIVLKEKDGVEELIFNSIDEDSKLIRVTMGGKQLMTTTKELLDLVGHIRELTNY